MKRFRLPLPRRISIVPELSAAAPFPLYCLEVEILEHDEAKGQTTLRATLGMGDYAYRTPILVIVDEIAAHHERLRDLLLYELVPDLRLVQ